MSLDLYKERKRVSVTFAGDDDIGKHILSLSVRGSKRHSNKKQQYKDDSDESEDAEVDESDDSGSAGEVFKPSEALAEESGLTGDKVYGFLTLKRASRMTAAASRAVEAITPLTPPKQPRGSAPSTPKQSKTTKGSVQTSPKESQTTSPKSILKRTRGASQILVESGQTPVGKRSSNRVKLLASLTPQRLASRRAVAQHDSSSEESAYSEESSSGESDSDCSEASGTSGPVSRPVPVKQSTPATPANTVKPTRHRNKKQPELDETVKADTVEEYFDAHSSGTVLTSDRTLSRLDHPRMDHEALARVLSGMEERYQDECIALLDEYRAHYNQWMFLLCHGYNLVFHGLGSKRHIMEEFRTTLLKDLSHIVVNGYFPSLTIKNILNSITEEIMEHEGSFRNPIEQCDYIRKHYECGEYEDFYLVIHNIDGSMLRGEKAQTVLSLLAQIRGFHIIASIDHINAPLMWDNTKCSRFNWLWYDVTNYNTYSEETSYENSLLVQQSGALALSSLTHVMRSLTPNAKGIFLLLVKHQLEHSKENAGYQGLSFADLYQKCREAFLVNSDLTLNTQLTEFKDHKLIKLKKGMDGVEYLNIPLDGATLKEFLEQQESEES